MGNGSICTVGRRARLGARARLGTPGPKRPNQQVEERGGSGEEKMGLANRPARARLRHIGRPANSQPGLGRRRVGLHTLFRQTKRKTEGPQHFAFPEISRENRGCLVLHSGNSRVSLSLRAGLGQNLRQN